MPTRPSSDDGGATSGPGLRALERLVELHGIDALLFRPPAPDVAQSLGETIAQLCAEAKRNDPFRAERMIIALRQAWPTLPAVQRLRPDDQRIALLNRIVTACIIEFYGADGARIKPIGVGDGASARQRGSEQ